MCVGDPAGGLYIWATYLRLEHYLLVPWLVLALGAAVALESAARALARRVAGTGRATRRPRALSSAAAVVVLAVGPRRATLGEPRTGAPTAPATTFVDARPRRAAPGRGDPVRMGRVDAAVARPATCSDRRPDVLIVDDTNIVYEGGAPASTGSPR